MRLIDADEIMEHVWRDKLDSRELIAEMIDNAPTVKKISTEIPINIFEQLILQQQKTGYWISDLHSEGACEFIEWYYYKCSICNYNKIKIKTNYCPNCGAKMEVKE